MKDTNDRVVSASMHAMADLVTVIGGFAVTGLVQSKVFVDGTPKVLFFNFKLEGRKI